MKRNFALLIAAVIAVAACDNSSKSEPRSEHSKVETTAQAEEPAPDPITAGTDAFDGVSALAHLRSGPDLAIATSNPGALAQSLKIESTSEGQGLRAGAPVLTDVHPDSLQSFGLDPAAPVALVRYARSANEESDVLQTDRWAFIAKIKDREALEKTFGEAQVLTTPDHDEPVDKATNEGMLRAQPLGKKDATPPKVWATEDGWAVIAPDNFRFARSRDASLANDESFEKHRKALKYGELATIWMRLPESQIALGLAAEDDKLGLKAVSAANEDAATSITKLPKRFGQTTLADGPRLVMLGVLGSSKEARELENKIDEARKAPRLRQIEKLTAAVADRTAEPVELEGAHAELLPGDELVRLRTAWDDAAITDEETQEIAAMESELEKLNKNSISSLFGDGADIAKLAGSSDIFGDKGGLEAKDFGSFEFGGSGDSKERFGGLGTVGRGGGGSGRSAGTIGGLAPRQTKSVKLSSADSTIKPHALRKLSRIKSCFRSGAPDAPFTVTANLSTDDQGKVSVGRTTGANAKVHSCVERALGGIASEKSVSGSVTFSFTEK